MSLAHSPLSIPVSLLEYMGGEEITNWRTEIYIGIDDVFKLTEPNSTFPKKSPKRWWNIEKSVRKLFMKRGGPSGGGGNWTLMSK